MIQNTAELISKQDGLTLSVLWTEPEKKVRGVVQISHGMSEHKERYLPFMKFLAGHGYAAVIHDHRGHGGSVREKEDLGYFYNTKEKGIIESLTGPVERCDISTIKGHCEVLSDEDRALYMLLSKNVLEIAMLKNINRDYSELEKYLGER